VHKLSGYWVATFRIGGCNFQDRGLQFKNLMKYLHVALHRGQMDSFMTNSTEPRVSGELETGTEETGM